MEGRHPVFVPMPELIIEAALNEQAAREVYAKAIRLINGDTEARPGRLLRGGLDTHQ